MAGARTIIQLTSLLAVAALASGCTFLGSTQAYVEGEPWDPYPNDPFEEENRYVYNFNSAIDQVFVEPTARAYTEATPEPVQGCVSNFFSNLREPLNAVSHLLAFNRESASQSVSRFLMNTVVGGAGCIDTAKEAGLEESPADLGLTVRSWGDTEKEQSVYFVLPFFGPSTVVDGGGSYVGRGHTHPFNFPYGKREDGEETRSSLAKYNPYGIRKTGGRYAAHGLDGFNTRAELLDVTDLVKEIALDEYSFVRDAYLEQRMAAAEELRQAD